MQEVARQAIREYVENHSRAELLDQVLDAELPATLRPWSASASDLPDPAELLHIAGRVLGRTTPCATTACSMPPLPAPGPPHSARTPTRTWTPSRRADALHRPQPRPHRRNKRLSLAAVIAFYGLNGRRLTLTNDAAYDLVISVASGQLDTVEEIAAALRPATRPRG